MHEKTKKKHSVILKALLILCAAFQAFTISAQQNTSSRWSVYAGANMSHFFVKPYIEGSKSYKCGFGGFLGGGYDFRFTPQWSLAPQVEIAYIDNGAKLSDKSLEEYGAANWHDSWNLMVPVVASFRFNVSEKVGLRIGAGPYIQYAFAAREYNPFTLEKVKCSGSIGTRFNFGTIEEIAVETGRHFSYMLRFQYPFLKGTWTRKTLTVSLGVKYSF